MINKLPNNNLDLQATSVYDFNELTLQELLCKFFSKINECVDVSNQALNFLTWLKEEGLPIEVQKEIEKMYVDGRLTEIINQLANDVKGQVTEIKQDLVNHKTEYEQFKTSTNETLSNHSSQLEHKANIKDIGKLTNSAPLFVNSTSEMTDITKIYVNKTDGFVYTHINETWTNTGVKYTPNGLNNKEVTPIKTTFLTDNSYNDNIWSYGDYNWTATGESGSVVVDVATLNINGGQLVNGITQFFSLKLDMSKLGEECVRFRFFQEENGGGLQVANVDVTKDMLDSNGVYKFNIHSASKSTKIYIIYQKSTTVITKGLNVYMKNIRLRLNKDIDNTCILNSNIIVPKVEELNAKVTNLEKGFVSSVWNNEEVLIIGDSITDDTYGNYKKWQYYWQQKTNAIMTCDGVHARGFVRDSPTFPNSSLYNRIMSGYYSTSKKYKLIVVFLATNDWGNNIPMGVSGGTEYGVNFIPTVEYCLKWLRETYLDAKICVLLPLQRSNIGVLGQGLYLKDYNEEIAKVCEHYSIPYLDLYTKGNFFPNNQKFSERWTYYAPTGTGSFVYDGLHPNEEFGKIMLMPTIYRFLENI